MENRRERRTRKRSIATYDSDSLQTSQSTFHDWRHDEKVRLLEALKKYGHYDLVNLHKAVPSKSKDQIKMAINMWWRSARTAMLATAGNKDKNMLKHEVKRGKGRPQGPSKHDVSDKAPIDQWLAKFEQAQPRQGHPQTKLLQKVFLYISKYENHPSPQDCNGVDYKAMYEYLYCMLSGYPGKTLNPETAKYVMKSLNDLALEIRERGIQGELFFLDCNQRISGPVRQYGGKKPMEPDSDLTTPDAVFKKLIKTDGLNPLNVPMCLLKK